MGDRPREALLVARQCRIAFDVAAGRARGDVLREGAARR